MANWNKTCREFKEIRELINESGYKNNKEILSRLSKICEKYARFKWDFAEDFEDLGMEIDCAIEDQDYKDEDTINYYLSEFYDLCDNSRVWLGI
jgi:hypothetical protein